MARTIAVANQKGGVGKTTTVENLGAALALEGKRVLLVDYDPQCSLTKAIDNDGGIFPNNIGSGYDLLPGNPLLATDDDAKINALADELEPVQGLYDYILIDCPPSLSKVAMMALYPADWVIVAVQPHYLAVAGISELLKTLQALNEAGARIQGAKCLLTMYERNGACKEMEAQVTEAYGAPYKTRIRKNVTLSYAQAAGVDVFQYDKRCNGAQDYKALACEIMSEG